MASASYAQNDARHYTSKLKEMLDDVAQHARDDIGKVGDPKAQALFETTAEVVLGLRKAYDDFEQRSESVWR